MNDFRQNADLNSNRPSRPSRLESALGVVLAIAIGIGLAALAASALSA